MFDRALETLEAGALREHQWRRVQALARALVGANPFWTARWRASGIAALHVAAWHFYDADAERDRYLKSLIEACHRHGILVYMRGSNYRMSAKSSEPMIRSGAKDRHFARRSA